MANHSEVRIVYRGRNGKVGFDATYFNCVKKEDNHVIAKAPNGQVVTEQTVDKGNLATVKKQVKEVVETELKRKWMDVDGNVYEKKDLAFFDWEGNPINENIKSEVFECLTFRSITDILDTSAFDGYYAVTPVDNENIVATDLWNALTKTQGAYVNDFSLSSKGFTKSHAALRATKIQNVFELMVFKAKKEF